MIQTTLTNETVLFAKEELEKYLSLLDSNIPMNFKIELGFSEETDDEMDTVEVNISENGGYLKGSNPRSVLFAVYQYLEVLGIRWVRHGKDGEYIPENVTVSGRTIRFKRTAKNKYRGMCIEGAVSIENMLDNIDWVAKMGFNTYFLQFIIPYTFFDRWYRHQWNPTKEGRKLTKEEAIEFRETMVREIKKRGLAYQAVGHGWTCIPFGLPGDGGWTEVTEEPSEEVKSVLAERNGKREFFHGIPMNTELCYSNPEARKKMVMYLADYAEQKKEVDVIHLWLSDGEKNHCECENCRKKSPSDFYVILLNEVDVELTKRGINTKIVFLIYHDLLWAPETETLKNPDRFILMFAPICRKYDTSYEDIKTLPEIPEFVRNQMDFPEDVEGNVAHLLSWQKVCPVNGFSFEYYYWLGEHYRDFGSFNLAKVIYEDIRNLENIGLSGIVSCQSQRAFMPTGLGSYVMGKALWDDRIPFEALVEEYFKGAFGELESVFKAHLVNLSMIAKETDAKTKFTQLKQASEEMLANIEKIKTLMQGKLSFCHEKSIEYIEFHCEFMILNAVAELALAEKGVQGSEAEWRELTKFVQENEDKYQSVLDLTQVFSDLHGRRHYELVELKLVED